MMDEWTAAKEKIIPFSIRRCDYHNGSEYIESLDTDRNIFVGTVNIRHYLNEQLLAVGGHIGDGIRPSERRKGYGTKMVALAVIEC